MDHAAARRFAGLAWALITYMIVPVILFEDRGVYDSIYRSQELFQQNWGEQLAGNFGFGLLNFLLCLPAFGLAALLWKVDVALARSLWRVVTC